MTPRCPECGKKMYSKPHVYRAALGTSRTLGKPVRFYPCPHHHGIFHLTTQV